MCQNWKKSVKVVGPYARKLEVVGDKEVLWQGRRERGVVRAWGDGRRDRRRWGDFERRLYSSCNVHELLSVSEAAESKEDSGDGMRKT